MTALLDLWRTQRKGARVTLLLDVSGSMGDDGGDGQTKLELATSAIRSALDDFSPNDQVSLVTFTTDDTGTQTIINEIVPYGPFDDNRAAIERSLGSIFPQSGTPLFEAIDTVYADAVTGYDPTLINAIVVLSDGANSDENPSDDQAQFDRLLANLSRGSEGQGSKPVRVFPIAYGAGASLDVLGAIAEAASSAVYDASDPRSIDKVFAEVISNF